VIPIIQKLRSADIAAGFDIDKKSVKAQMKAADKSGAEYTVVVGEDEIANNAVTLRNMKSGDQRQIPLPEFIAQFKTLLKK